MLKEIEKKSDLKFEITLMTYARAKMELRNQTVDLIGHIPVGLEEPSFYKYATELKWSVQAKSDIFAMTAKSVVPETFKKLSPIGVPRGNKEFLGNMAGVPLDNITEINTIESMVKMLKLGRLKGIIFERSSVMSAITKQKIEGVHYKMHPPKVIPTGFAVQKSIKGKKLGEKIDNLISIVDKDKIFKNYFKYMNLPDSGIVSIK